MIQFTCSACGKQFAVRDELAGRDGKCACGSVVRVPNDMPIAGAKVTNPGRQRVGAPDLTAHDDSTKGGDGPWTRSEKLLLVGGITVAALLIPVLLYFIIWRDQWANEHRQSLLELNTQAESLVRQNEYERAKGKYDELLGQVNERDLADGAFRQTIDAARLASATNNKKLEVLLAARAEAEQQKQRRDAQRQATEAARLPKERYYRDSHGAIISETESENKLAEIRRNIASMPDNAERAYYEGVLKACEKEWARIKQQGPIEQ